MFHSHINLVSIVLWLSPGIPHRISIPIWNTVLVILSLRSHVWLRRNSVAVTLMLHSSLVVIAHARWHLVHLRIHLRVPTTSHIWLRGHVGLLWDGIHKYRGCPCDNQFVSCILSIIIFLLRSDIIISISLYSLHQNDLGLCHSQFGESATTAGPQN